MNERLPLVIGAALPISALPTYRNWLLAEQRDLELWDFCDANLLDEDWRPRINEARSLLDGYSGRLGIHGPYDGLPLTCSDKRVRALVVDRLKQGLEVAAALEASHMVVHSPFDFFGSPMVAHAAGSDLDELIEQAHATIEPVLALATQAGCTLVIEVCYDKNSAPLLALVRSFGGADVQLSLDVGHALIMQQVGGPPPDQWVRDGGALLGHLHLHDNDGLLDRHWAPGEGCLNWYALFEALSELEHRPRTLIELNSHNVDKIWAAADWLSARGWVR